jgi:hypothetical protein
VGRASTIASLKKQGLFLLSLKRPRYIFDDWTTTGETLKWLVKVAPLL